jgi:hypothetical protein
MFQVSTSISEEFKSFFYYKKSLQFQILSFRSTNLQLTKTMVRKTSFQVYSPLANGLLIVSCWRKKSQTNLIMMNETVSRNFDGRSATIFIVRTRIAID